MYEYNWVYTIAQIDLMNIDAPITCYKEREKDKNEPPTRQEMNDVVAKWQERKKKRKWKMQDLLKGKVERRQINDNNQN